MFFIKNEEENEFRKRQELRRLKMLDTQENYIRKKRIIVYQSIYLHIDNWNCYRRNMSRKESLRKRD